MFFFISTSILRICRSLVQRIRDFRNGNDPQFAALYFPVPSPEPDGLSSR